MTTFDPVDDDDIRATPEVRHHEQLIRDAVRYSCDGWEWLFTKPGREANARLAAARVRAALDIARSNGEGKVDGV